MENQPSFEQVSSDPRGFILKGRYKIGRLIGEGAQAKVYKVVDLQDQSNNLAIKIQSNYTKLTKEIKIMKRIKTAPTIFQYGVYQNSDLPDQRKILSYVIMTRYD